MDRNTENLHDRSIFSDTMVEFTWEEVQEKANKDTLVLFPISIVEEHGPHMDLSPDINGANIYCKLIKQKLYYENIDSVIAPPYYWGINTATGRFPGSFTLKPETFEAVLFELFECLIIWGFTKVFAFNLHGDRIHCSTIVKALGKVRSQHRVYAFELFDLSRKVQISHESFREDRENRYSPDRYAGATETAFINYYLPQSVRKEIIQDLRPQSSFEDPMGYLGDPASYKLENEKDASERISEYYVEVIKSFLKHPSYFS